MASSFTPPAPAEPLPPPVPLPGYRTGYVSLLAAGIGILAGLLAFALYDLIALFTNLAFYHQWSLQFRSPEQSQLGAWIIVIPVVGGLIVGVMEKYGSEKIRGHGIPEAMEAVLTYHSKIEAKVAILKPLSAAVAIGTGGPFGAEGPIIQTGGAFGSLIGQVVATTSAERKILLACGAGAGMAATFNTPIAGVILAIELLTFEFRSRSFIPLVIACTLATGVRSVFLGQNAMFTMQATNFDVVHTLPLWIVLGGICGVAAIGFTKLLYWTEDRFDSLPIDSFWLPAIGAAGLGVIGFFVPRVLGVGYDTISDILNNNLAWHLLLVIAIFKSIALVISLGSGTSGGLLAPMFTVGAALGSLFAMTINDAFPSAHLSPGAYALVAMAAVFGSAARVPFTLFVFAFEITRNYNAVVPLMLACVIADAIAIRYLPNSIMTEKLARRGIAVLEDFETGVLKMVRVSEVMRKDVEAVPDATTTGELIERMQHGEKGLSLTQGLPIVDAEGKLTGVITHGDLLRALQKDPSGTATILEAGSQAPVVAYPDEMVYDALTHMLQRNIGRLPVVEREDPARLVGFLDRASVLNVWARQIEQETVREQGWLRWKRRLAKEPRKASIPNSPS